MVDWIHKAEQLALNAEIAKWMDMVMATTGWSANQWAQKSGVTATTITRFIKDKNFNLGFESICQLARSVRSMEKLCLRIDFSDLKIIKQPRAEATLTYSQAMFQFMGLDWDGSVTAGRVEAERQGKNPYEISEETLSELGKRAQLAADAEWKEAERARKSAEWVSKRNPNYQPPNDDNDIPF